MSEVKHTPLPWRWDEDAGCFIIDARGNVVAEIPCQGGNRADGPLIVSAVNSAAAAEGMREALEFLIKYEMPLAMTGSVAQRWDDARAALKLYEESKA